ncbi:acyl carrier protein [Nonomuraea sp. NPDC049152]|uniref:acyl carrier protein n=1 Tax=Nonomuraea sp. NPDC049152 TaxID=3154350 RepID=UPI0033C91AF3
MSDEEIFVELRAICARILSVDPAVIAPDLDLRDELEADSLDMAELAAATEDRFKIVVDLDTAKQARTLADVVTMVRDGGHQARAAQAG